LFNYPLCHVKSDKVISDSRKLTPMKELVLISLFLTIVSVPLTNASGSPQYDVIIVRSDLPMDWVIAQAYAQNSGVPIVVTKPDYLDDDVKDQLGGYLASGFNNLIIIGGEEAISPMIKSKLDDMGFITHRISEGDRYGTSARVSIELFKEVEGAVLVRGEGYEGLLVAERVASSIRGPIMFVKGDKVSPSVEKALVTIGVKKVYLVEGISPNIREDLLSKGYDLVIIDNGWKGESNQYDSFYIPLVLGFALGAATILIWVRFRKLEDKVSFTILTKDEEKIVKYILKNGGVLTQDKLPKVTDFSRPKISRMIMDLSTRGIISKEPYGKTQKLTIKKDFYD